MTAAAGQVNRGILLFVAAWLIIPAMDASAKTLTILGYAVLLVAWARFAANLVLALPLLLTLGRHGSGFAHPGVQTVRALALVFATVFFFQGLSTLPLADALAVYFVYPFLVTALAPIVLGERRWSAVGAGFCGTLLIVRPGFAEIDSGVVAVLAAGVAFAIYNLLTRRLSGHVDRWRTLAFQATVGTVVLAPFAVANWSPPDGQAMALVAVIGAVSIVGHWLVIRAYDLAPAAVLAPFSYVEMTSAAAYGYVIFGDFPDAWTWAGILVIAASGTYIAVRERRLASVDQR